MPDAGHDSKTEHDFCPGGGGTVNQYSETEVGGLTLSDWDCTETSDKITLTKYKGDAVNVVIPSEFAEAPGKSVEIATFMNMFDKDKLVSLKVGTSNQKVTLGASHLRTAFFNFNSLVAVDLSGLDTSNVTNMYRMFRGCMSLESLDLSGFDTSNVTNMVELFRDCRSLKSLNLSSFDTSNVTNMSFMFHDCRSLESLDLSNFDTSNVITVESMFFNTSSLERLDLSNFYISDSCNTIWVLGFGYDQILDYTIPTLIITSDQRIINEIVTDADKMTYRTPYHAEAKVIYNSNHEVFDDGNTMIEKTIHQSDRFVYSSLEEIKQELIFDAATILKDSPKLADKENYEFIWYLDEACTMPFDEASSVDFATLIDNTLPLYAGYKEVMPEEPETPEEKPTEPEEKPSEPEEKPTEPQDQPNTPNEEEKGESNIEEIKKEESEAVNTGDEVSKGMYYVLLGGSMIVFAAMLRKNRRSEQ